MGVQPCLPGEHHAIIKQEVGRSRDRYCRTFQIVCSKCGAEARAEDPWYAELAFSNEEP